VSSPPPHPHQAYVPTLRDGRPDKPGLVTVIAVLDIVFGLGGLVTGALAFIGGATTPDADAGPAMGFGVVLAVMGVLGLISAAGLLLVRPWGRVFQIVTSILGLFCLGPGTIVNALILVYMFSRKIALIYSGRRVADMSEPERHLIAGTGQATTGQAGSGGNVAGIVIAVVVGGMMLVAMIGIIAAIAIPNLLNAIQRGKQKRTMSDVRAIATAVESRATDFNAYPEATSVDELIPVLVPTYAPSLPMKDGWEQPFDVRTTGLTYTIRSSGKDKLFEVDDPNLYERGVTTSFAADIVFMNGEFVRYPEGTQQ